MRTMGEYVLGTDDAELARLGLQQEVWGAVTARFLDRCDLRAGARVLDVGCGPGFVLGELRRRVGEAGEVVGLDASPRWGEVVRGLVDERGWENVRFVEASLEDHDPGEGRYDLIFARWVLGFLPDPLAQVRRLARALAPGGVLAVQDYNHEGVSLFPESEGFRAIVRATRALYATRGGDTWLGARLPGMFRACGLGDQAFDTDVLAGSPGSPAFRWADAFFPHHSQGMVDAGVLSADERSLFLTEWEQRRSDPAATFFSPIVVSVAGKKG